MPVKTKIISVVMFCMCLSVCCACAGPFTNGKQENDSLNAKTQAEDENSQQDKELHENAESGTSDAEEDGKDDSQMKGSQQEDASLEEELSRYRQEREDGIQQSSGAVLMEQPELDSYAFIADLYRIISRMPQFDTKEMGEAYAASESYIKDVLAIQPPTKNIVYMCVDPRMAAIYEDNDKGVAAGYANDQIYITEYCDGDGVWQYLILARDGKEAPWQVIHNGRSYKE